LAGAFLLGFPPPGALKNLSQCHQGPKLRNCSPWLSTAWKSFASAAKVGTLCDLRPTEFQRPTIPALFFSKIFPCTTGKQSKIARGAFPSHSGRCLFLITRRRGYSLVGALPGVWRRFPCSCANCQHLEMTYHNRKPAWSATTAACSGVFPRRWPQSANRVMFLIFLPKARASGGAPAQGVSPGPARICRARPRATGVPCAPSQQYQELWAAFFARRCAGSLVVRSGLAKATNFSPARHAGGRDFPRSSLRALEPFPRPLSAPPSARFPTAPDAGCWARPDEASFPAPVALIQTVLSQITSTTPIPR